MNINQLCGIIEGKEYGGNDMLQYNENEKINCEESESFAFKTGHYLAHIISVEHDDYKEKFILEIELCSYIDVENDIEEECWGEVLTLNFFSPDTNYNVLAEAYESYIEDDYFVESQPIGDSIAFDVEIINFGNFSSYKITDLQII